MPTSARDIQDLREQLDAADRDAQALVAGLSEQRGGWRVENSWSVAECLDHLASTNHEYLRAMKQPAIRARERGKLKRGPAVPGFVGRWFVRAMEPPVRALLRAKAPQIVEPRCAPPLEDAFARFKASQDEVRAFLVEYSDLDLGTVGFPNPFVRGIRFSLATGLHVITAHDRRHLWQAWRVRRAAEGG